MPENPNIVVFIKGLDLGGNSGGADLFGAHLARQLAGMGNDVRLLVLYRFNTDRERKIVDTLSVNDFAPFFLLEWSGESRIQSYLNALVKLNAYLSGLRIDIIHSHFHMGTLLSVIAKITNKVDHVVRTAHVDHEWMRGWRGLFQQTVIRCLIFIVFPLFVDLEAGVSNYSVEILNQRFLSKLKRKKAVVIHNAIPLGQDLEAHIKLRDYERWQGDHPIIGSVGRLEDQKGYTYLISAIPELIRRFSEVELWLIGDGPLYDRLVEQCKELGIQNKVVFWGKQENIPEFLSKMDLFVLPSIYEGLPTVVLEAMAEGIPCVVTDIPGTRDIVEDDNVLAVSPRDSSSLANVINHALGMPSLRRRLAENATSTLKKFSIEKISTEYMDAYRKL